MYNRDIANPKERQGNQMEFAEKLLRAAAIIAAVWLMYQLALIIHECGHLVMAKLTGYRFVSFRIGPLTLVRERGKLKLRNTGWIKGTGGQCVMLPPETRPAETVPVVPYYLGGGLFNLLTALLAVPAGFAAENRYVKAVLILLGVVSAAQALMNLIPSGQFVLNDGYQIRQIRNSPADRAVVCNSLRISGHSELSFSEMPEAYFAIPDDTCAYAYIAEMLRGQYMLDCGNFQEAEALFVRCCGRKRTDQRDLYQSEAASSLLLCMLLRGADADEIGQVYDSNLQQYLELAKQRQIDKRCIMYAYQLLFCKDADAAKQEYEAMLQLQSDAPAGDVKTQKMLTAEVQKRAECLSAQA
jgi:hypothetical protein